MKIAYVKTRKDKDPILEPLREDVHSNEALLEEMIEMALIKTESSPADSCCR